MRPLRSFREDVLWLAGLWEGEGSFVIHNRVPIMSLGMTDEDTVRRAYQIMRISRKLQVCLRNPRGFKTLYSLQVNASQAVGWMMILYPFMHQRRRQKIREILDTGDARPWRIAIGEDAPGPMDTMRNAMAVDNGPVVNVSDWSTYVGRERVSGSRRPSRCCCDGA